MNPFRRLLLLFVGALIALGCDARSDTVVSLITCYPGKDIYELEGHTAIRVATPQYDTAISYGLFDFDSPNFVYRFVKGETDYMVGAIPWDWFIGEYRKQGRRVDEQVLNLSSAQKARLIDLLARNMEPQNRVYRYNYVKDNCATRPLAMIQAAVGDSVKLGPTVFDTWSRPTSFRDVMRFYHRNYPWYQFGIDLALGSGIDYPLQSAEYAFAPVLLEQQIEGATVDGRHLASPAVAIVDFPADNAVEGATPLYLTPLFVCWLVFALILWATVRDQRRRKVTKWIDALYFGIMGLAGLLLAFLIFVSVHEATSPNWLFLWLNPFCLIPTIFIWLKKCKKLVLSYQIVNFALVLGLAVAWIWLPQSANAAFLPLVLADLLRSVNYITLNYNKKAQSTL